MRVVLDTNIIVSALLTPTGKPARIMNLVINGKLTPLFDVAVLEEYRVVLARPRLQFQPSLVGSILDYLEAEGMLVSTEPCNDRFNDESDRKFFEVALAGGAEALITGNIVHFPQTPVVMTPALFLNHWAQRTSKDEGGH